jgi:O-acetylserine/cysteine efflux transporter
MNVSRTRAVAALTAAGLAWGSSVPLSKLALDWLAPGWLTVIRFALAAAAALAVVPRPKLRAAFTPAVLVSGAVGYGGCILAQNAGLARTSVTDAALLIGASPVVVAVITAAWHRTVARPVAWAGFVLSLAGVVLVAGGGGAGAGAAGVGMGDALVLVSVLLSAGMTVAQGGLLENRDPVAVSAVQFLGAALAALPFAAAAEGVPSAPPGVGPVLAVAALTAAGTLLPFTLFAYGQRRVPPQIAGAFLNLEPLVGALAGIIVFGDPAGLPQLAGGTAILAGIGMGSVPMFAGRRKVRLAGSPWPKRISHSPRTSRPARCRSSCSGTTPVLQGRTGSAAMRRYPGSSQVCACWTQVSGGYLTGGRAARRNPPRPRTCGAAPRSSSAGRQCDQDCRRSRARRPLPCYLRHILKLLHVTASLH